MPETIEALLWCAARATWLMMFFTIVRKGVNEILGSVRRRMGRQAKVLRSPFGQKSRETWRPE